MTTEKRIKITLIRSIIGQKRMMKATVKALGLRRMHHTVTQRDTPVARGMVRRIAHLVTVHEA